MQLNELVDANALVAEREAWAVGGVAPGAVVAPGSRAEAARVVDAARTRGWAVVPLGGGTQAAAGAQGAPAPRRLDLVLSTRRLDRVVDYQPDDMTVTLEPGVTLAALARLLAPRGQFLPLDPPLPARATVGGTVAAAAAGPWRAAYGTPRDWLIGCRVLGADGLEVRGGGQVVKNVAGYDLPKVYTGSWGTLGLLTELTFKVLPQPPARAWSRVTVADAAAAEALLGAVMGSDLEPAALELLVEGKGAGLAWSLVFEFLHFEEAVAWQQEELERLAGTLGAGAARLSPDAGAALSEALRDGRAAAPFAARIGTVSSLVAPLAEEAANCLAAAGLPPAVQAHAATGQVHVLGGAETPEAVAGTLRALAAARGATCTFPRLPAALVGRVDPWGPVGPELRLMQGIKAALDPHGVFSPGCFVGGI